MASIRFINGEVQAVGEGSSPGRTNDSFNPFPSRRGELVSAVAEWSGPISEQ